MGEEPPPEPPDPGAYVTVTTEPMTTEPTESPQAMPMDFETTTRGTKRSNQQSESDQIGSSSKKTITDPGSTTPSIQNVYLHPSLSDAPKKYLNDDKGPFIVYVSREVSDPSAGASMRAITFGQFLHRNRIRSILNDGIKSVGRNKVSVEFSCVQAANEFLENPILKLSKYTAFIPTFNITRMGLVRGVPVDWHLEEFIESLELPTGCGEILKARRLNRKDVTDGVVTWIPTQSIVLTFRGQSLPNRIYSYHTSLPVETYRLPTIQCLNCCRFGHIKAQCRSKPRCFKCSQPHTGESCGVSTENSTCLLCSGRHMATNKNCPEHSRQHAIKLLMSEENLSYQDASSRFPPVQRSYAEVAKEIFTPPTYSPRPSTPNPRVRPTSTPTKSYRQTTLRSPRPRPQPTKGYDRQAHQDIIRNFPSSSPNGCALNTEREYPYASSAPNNDISHLIKSLTNILEMTPLPSNAAEIIIKVVSILSNGLHGDTPVELPKCTS
ncbi:uncharacterized protein [Maniola hyperantus]|uniref:uncharacterized protein n=1 Tax=Aphantopus hyperantus TaxID=2795564 RepID=UPI003748EE3C